MVQYDIDACQLTQPLQGVATQSAGILYQYEKHLHDRSHDLKRGIQHPQQQLETSEA